ncbi:MAG: hypothetical protein A3D96_03060 [Chlamydiae bacterium RIFCSPHIGHO2_12_FULL_44_59]|nr:MAG: hypothetical protein A2796_01350 [Chlamydiae bacterium RIFCSPHIGHO2_01_FULL_44_39]OGN57396.1 MAG: hypothetical protein A3C42_03580 [Chlamydiae bacterium RIFCSPHIGHO2_02_FULL_45_9]OGN60962.1 MAG: hypothetical protein A3D96_03060 [Chlamydiae bacterium RIFCSPHIGHO2_12_FULL_44_59]OGN66650.1 MAG: hypothetical protein A2978_01560 [Chlamydiae bacterium RIFCSPLOWO2_01_FULL_44_52]OGN69654.1 MAG: hypothetical protein A3I67_06460 [Chlamydiae bacterium RIFCSPLOWO2_02_FULL_45_22]OGN70894.1 MAG: hyp
MTVFELLKEFIRHKLCFRGHDTTYVKDLSCKKMKPNAWSREILFLEIHLMLLVSWDEKSSS